MPPSSPLEERLDRLMDLLERQIEGRAGTRRVGHRSIDSDEIHEEWKKFSENIVKTMRASRATIEAEEKKRIDATIQAVNSNGNIPEKIKEMLSNAFSPSTPGEIAAQLFDQAKAEFKKLFDENQNPAIKEVLDSLERIEEERQKYSRDYLDKAQKKFERIRNEGERRIEGIFGQLQLRYAGFDQSPWYLILRDIANGKDPNASFLTQHFINIGNTVRKFLEPLNLFLNGMRLIKEQTIDLIKVLDTTQTQFMKATGFASGFTDELEDAWGEVRYFGVTLEEVNRAFTTYIDKFSAFTKLNADAQRGMVELGTVAARLGVSVEDSAKMFDFFQSSLRRGSSGAKQGLLTIIGVAETLGESFQKISGQFTQMLPTIAKWGQQTENVFKKIAATAKALNIEMNELLQIAQQFDTFDTAAQHVGRLNAILGGPFLNTMNMLNSTEGEVIQQLHLAFKASGKNWEALSRHERQAVATAAGINDMNVAQKLFTGSLVDVNRFLAQQSITQDELNERSQRATTITEKFQMILQSLAFVAEPLLDALQFIVGGFLDLTEAIGGWTIPLVFVAIGAFTFLTKGLGNFGAMLASLPGKLLALIPGLKGVADKLFGVKDAAAGVAKPGLGEGIGKFFASIANGIKIFVTTMASLVGIAGQAAAAILLIGGAIAIVAGIFAVFIGAAVGVANFFSGLGEAAKTDALTDFANAVGDMSRDVPGKFNAVASSVERMSKAISEIPSANISGYIDLMESIEDIADAAQSNFASQFLGSLSNVLSNVQVTPAISANAFVTNNVDEERQKNQTVEMLMSRLDRIIEALSGNKPGSPTSSKESKLSIEMDGTVLAEKVIEVIEDKWRLR